MYNKRIVCKVIVANKTHNAPGLSTQHQSGEKKTYGAFNVPFRENTILTLKKS